MKSQLHSNWQQICKTQIDGNFLTSRQEPELYFIQNNVTYQPCKYFPVYYAAYLKEKDAACEWLIC